MVTDHALHRLRERVGINKKSCAKYVSKVYEQGIRHGETNGNLHKYISMKTCNVNKKGNEPVVYGEHIYWFVSNLNKETAEEVATLVTVHTLPNNLRKLATKLQEKKG